jgi:hypothetical protein
MASKWMNQVVHLWVLGRLAREQELNEKSVLSMHHSSMVVRLWVLLVHSGKNKQFCFNGQFFFVFFKFLIPMVMYIITMF